jgi:hypothetical protein
MTAFTRPPRPCPAPDHPWSREYSTTTIRRPCAASFQVPDPETAQPIRAFGNNRPDLGHRETGQFWASPVDAGPRPRSRTRPPEGPAGHTSVITRPVCASRSGRCFSEDTRAYTTVRPDTPPTDTSTTIVPDGKGRVGTGIRSSLNHRHTVWGCTRNHRAHPASSTHSVKHTFDHKHPWAPERLRTPRSRGLRPGRDFTRMRPWSGSPRFGPKERSQINVSRS